MAEYFDAIIVGSGFGGSVMAYRLAEAGLSVCLLERGKPFPPGSFPRSPHQLKKNFWDPSEGKYGMFNFWTFRGIESLVSSGLGGGSLIYANVMLRKDEKWFVKEDIYNGGYEYWPVNREDLDPHYEVVEKILNVQKYPFESLPYSNTSKTIAMKKFASESNSEWMLPPLAVTFANQDKSPIPGEPIVEPPGMENLHGRTRLTCRLCGECDIGCNYGSKNSLDYNYLTLAKKHGAQIKTLCEVRDLKPDSKYGYTVSYVEHDPEKWEGTPRNTKLMNKIEISSRFLIVSAGTLGSTYLMLKNKINFPSISNLLGTRFGGNGDFLTFATYCKSKSGNVISPRVLDPSYGPVITSAIRIASELDGDGNKGRGYYIQDAGFPGFLGWMLEASDLKGYLVRSMNFALKRYRAKFDQNFESDFSAEFSDLIGDCELSSASLPLLGMGRDVPNGKVFIKNSYLDIDWSTKKSKEYFSDIRKTMQEISTNWEGRFSDNLLWHLNRVITVHPLGGCPMGDSIKNGVVDSNGQVFNYPGLYVADGSVMPGPVGANPSLTIAALSNRFAESIIETFSKSKINYEL